MRVSKTCYALLGIVLFATTGLARSPRASKRASRDTRAVPGEQAASAKIIDRIIRREQNEIASFQLFNPIVETYIQQLKPDREMGTIPLYDSYFIGQADLSHGVAIQSLLRQQHGALYGMLPDFTDEKQWDPRGFLQMIYVDRYYFDRSHYDFKYAGQDFLGAIRCLMFDVTPKRHAGKDRFKGRIWVEDHDYTIVRFNGAYVPIRPTFGDNFGVHFDSWRMNVQPDLWLPAYVFAEGVNVKPGGPPKFKAQTLFWGYSPKAAVRESEFSDLYIEPDQGIQDDSTREHDLSPIQEQRRFDRDAEDNALETLVRAGIIAPKGPVDQILDTAVNNLEVTNHLDIEPELRCRVMLTSNIELFSIGHTIVLSRGLLDVIPDEPTLAVMLAQEVSDAMVWKPDISTYGFYDLLQTPTTETMKEFSFKDSPAELQATSARALEILRNSPYRSHLGTAALFLKKLSEESKLLPHLVGPNLGNRIYPIAALMNSGPVLEPRRIDQIPALPMGSRIKLDPWDDDIQMLKTRTVALESPREKMAFEITPSIPYLTRYQELHAAEEAAQTGGNGRTESARSSSAN